MKPAWNLAREICNETFRHDSEEDMMEKIISRYGMKDSMEGRIGDVKWAWGHLGGVENNLSNVKSNSDVGFLNGLNEKVLNAQDAVITKECYDRNIDPEGPEAPQSSSEAVEKFYDVPKGDYAHERRPDLSDILVIAENVGTTYEDADPTFSILDKGCGILPGEMADTILGSASSKITHPFTVGRFGRGNQGAIPLAGKHGIQICISKACSSHPRREEDPYADHWSFTFTYKVSCVQLTKMKGDGKKRDLGSVLYLTLEGEVPHFPADTIAPIDLIRPLEYKSLDAAKNRNRAITKRNRKQEEREKLHGFKVMESGTLVRIFNLDINRNIRRLGGAIGNCKEIFRLNNVYRSAIPSVMYPLRVIQPNKEDGTENPSDPSGQTYGFLPFLRDKKHFSKGVGGGKGKPFFCEPIKSTLQTHYGDIDVEVFLVSEKATNFAAGSRGAYWRIGAAWAEIEPGSRLVRGWNLGSLHKHAIIVVDLTKCDGDFIESVLNVDRAKLTWDKETECVRENIVKLVNELPAIENFKKYLQKRSLTSSTDKRKGARVSEFFKGYLQNPRATKGSKIAGSTCTDGGDLLNSCGKGKFAPTNLQSIITEVHLIDQNFKSYWDEDTDSSFRAKEVNIHRDRFRIQLFGNGNKSFWEKHSIGFQCALSSDGKEWTPVTATFNECNSLLTFTFETPKLFRAPNQRFEGRIRLFPRDPDKCNHESFEIGFTCQNAKRTVGSTASTGAVNRSKSNKGGGGHSVSFKIINKEEVGDFMMEMGPHDLHTSMLPEGFIGYMEENGERTYVLNKDSKKYKDFKRGILKHFREDVPDAESLEDVVYGYWKVRVESFEASLQERLSEKGGHDSYISTLHFADCAGVDAVCCAEIMKALSKKNKV